MQTKRDISIIDLSPDEFLVIACDALGGIGSKKEDKINVNNRVVGRLTTRVALMEVLASGAEIVSVINTLSVELDPTGQEIITGIKDELKKLDTDNLLTGSSEENIATVQTGLGVTAIGKVSNNKLKLSSSKVDDLVVAIGLPKVGEEVLAAQNQIADLNAMLRLLKVDYIHEIIPVGSKGILYEANVIANSNGLNLRLLNPNLDLSKSAGPATVILLTIKEIDLNNLKQIIDKPINVIARIDAK